MKTPLLKKLLAILLFTIPSLSSFSQGQLRIINSDTVITLKFADAKWLNTRFKEMEDSLGHFRLKYLDKHADYDSLVALHLQNKQMSEDFKKDLEEEKKMNQRLHKYVQQSDAYRTISVASSWFTIIGLTVWFMVLASGN